jgi:hypothetical protein
MPHSSDYLHELTIDCTATKEKFLNEIRELAKSKKKDLGKLHNVLKRFNAIMDQTRKEFPQKVRSEIKVEDNFDERAYKIIDDCSADFLIHWNKAKDEFTE